MPRRTKPLAALFLTVGIDELLRFARHPMLERSAGRQRPTFPRIEGGEDFPVARVGKRGEM